MGYLSQRGKIGQYKGKDVYVFELSDVEPWMKHTDHIFLAMIRPEGHHAQLVLDGIIVGEMDDAGCIKLYENGKRRAYVWDEEPVVKKKYPKKRLLRPFMQSILMNLAFSLQYFQEQACIHADRSGKHAVTE